MEPAAYVLEHFIAGRFVAGRADTLEVVDPARDAVVAHLPRGDAATVDAAVRAALGAAPAWRRTSVTQRAELLEAVAAALADRAEVLARLESEDTGKPLGLTRRVDIPRAIANFRFFAGAIQHDATAFHAMQDGFNYSLRRPVGVCGLITPWNLPLYLLTWKLAPALGMGNTVVAKPSELTPRTADALARVFADVGAPPGIFNVVHGTGPEAGAALVEHPGIAAVSFTGGTATGARVAAAAAPRFKKLSLELGGKNPTLVFADAPLDAAVEGAARAAFLNQGQICLCGSRLLVQRPILDAFVDALRRRATRLRVGDPLDPATDLGALISRDHRAKVEAALDEARAAGAEITGGGRPSLAPPWDCGAFLEPAVVMHLPHDCKVAQEEIFGPVVTVHAFDDDAEAVRLANDVRYGLAASLWTRDLRRAHQVAAELDTGMVWINTWLRRDLRVPFGGTKDSGVGREGGPDSLEFFSERRNVCVDLGDPPTGPGFPGVSPATPTDAGEETA